MVHYIRILFVVVVVLIRPGFIVLSQEYTMSEFQEGLNLSFTIVDEKQFEKALKLLNEGADLMRQAKEIYYSLTEDEKKEGYSGNYRRMVKLMYQASDKYKEGHDLIYQVFSERARLFWETMKKSNHWAAGMDKAKYYERMALKNINRALIKRDQATINEKYEWILVKTQEAYDLERLAIRDQGRALQICQDYPVEYNYGWEDDITTEEVVESNRSAYVNEPTDEMLEKMLARSQEEKQEEPVDTIAEEGEIIFRVQIAAHTVPLTDEYLETIYKGNMKIRKIYEENWYKYQIGIFKNFEEADKVLHNCNVKKAFIVPYQNGKKLTIQEAFEKLGMVYEEDQ